MRQIHSIYSGAVFVIVSAVVSGCSSTPSPKDVTTSFLQAVAKGDLKTAVSFDQHPDTSFLGQSNTEQSRMALDILADDKFTVGDQTVSGNNATVSVSVTAPDMLQILPKLMQEDIALALAGTDFNSQSGQKLMMKQLDNMLTSPQVPLTKSTADMNLTQVSGVWKITDNNTDMMNALTGNLGDAVKASSSNGS